MDKKKTINEVVAANLRDRMGKLGMVQTSLAKKSGVPQTTISLYLNPENRKPTAKGKAPSGKLAEVEAMAEALGCSLADLLTDPESQLETDQGADFETLAMIQLRNEGADVRAIIEPFIATVSLQRRRLLEERAQLVRNRTPTKV